MLAESLEPLDPTVDPTVEPLEPTVEPLEAFEGNGSVAYIDAFGPDAEEEGFILCAGWIEDRIGDVGDDSFKGVTGQLLMWSESTGSRGEGSTDRTLASITPQMSVSSKHRCCAVV